MDSEFQIGDWRVDVPRNRLVRSDHPEHSVRIEPKAMRVLVYLAQHATSGLRAAWKSAR